MTNKDQKTAAEVVVALVAGVGLLSFGYAAWIVLQDDLQASVVGFNVGFLHAPSAAIVFSILFVVGAFGAMTIDRTVYVVVLLPLLVLALVPVFSSSSSLANVPVGGIVAFEQRFDVDGEDRACPSGWSEVSRLAGRFPIGAGQGPSALRSIGDPQFGREVVTLERSNLPSHSHELPVDEFGSNGAAHLTTTAASDEGLGPRRAYTGNTGDGAAFDIMPPANVVQFCRLDARVR